MIKLKNKFHKKIKKLRNILDLKKGIVICTPDGTCYDDNYFYIKNIYTNEILFKWVFDIDLEANASYLISENKEKIYLFLEKYKINEKNEEIIDSSLIYSLCTITYKLTLIYEDKDLEYTNIYLMNNSKFLAIHHIKELKRNDFRDYIKVIDIESKEIVKDVFFGSTFPNLSLTRYLKLRRLIFTKDDKYVVTKEWNKLQIHSIETGNLVYERKEDSIMEFNTIQSTDFVFTKDNKYLLFGVEKNFSGNDDDIFTANNEKLFKLLWVIDFETKDFCYELAEKYIGSQLYQDHDNYSSNYGYCSAENLTISNDGKYAFLYTDKKYTIPFEIATGEILYLPNWCRFFFDEKYPNHVGMYYESINEYVLAEIEYKDLY